MDRLTTRDKVQGKEWLSESEKIRLLDVIAASFGGIDADLYFARYFCADGPFKRIVRLYYSGDNCIGYCLLTFRKRTLREKSVTQIGASAAFLPSYRQGGLTLAFSLKQAFLHRLQHPFTSVYYADTMLSPAMYRAIAKYTAVIHPSLQIPEPDEELKNLFEQFNPDGYISSHYPARCLVDTGRFTAYESKALDSLMSSDKPEIAYYCRLNPQFNRGIALFVIIPVTFGQFIKSAFRALQGVKPFP